MGNAGNKDPSDLRIGAVGSSHSSTPTDAATGLEGGLEGVEPTRGDTAADATSAVEGVHGPQSASGSDEIAAALGSGTIDSAQAKAQLIDQAVRAQLPPGADAATIAAVRSQVEALLANDPILENLLGRA